jgi:RNA polymerase sigma-70 factor (sigma-E family)
MRPAAGSFDGFVDANVDALLRTATLITWDAVEAEDLVQECLIRVAKRWPRIAVMELPAAYARRVLINLALDSRGRRLRWRAELRQQTSHEDVDPFEVLEDVRAEAAFEVLGDRAELVQALGELSAQQRTVLALRYFEDLSEAQIADLLGCSKGTVKTSASRGLARLRELIDIAPAPPTEACGYE